MADYNAYALIGSGPRKNIACLRQVLSNFIRYV